MDKTARRRGGSFHEEDDDEDDTRNEDVQFMTPYFDGNSNLCEPLDLSKICLDDDIFDDNNNDDDDYDNDYDNNSNSHGHSGHSGHNSRHHDVNNSINSNSDSNIDEEMDFTRGRSRSRSVHMNDDHSIDLTPGSIPSVSDSIIRNSRDNSNNEQKQGNGRKNKDKDKAERTGPLQHREVVALKKGLEEANHGYSQNKLREEEEERIMADAERRRRLQVTSTIATINPTDPVGRRVKLLMLGDSGVGKSSLIYRWTLDTFSPSLTSTVGVNFKSKKIDLHGEIIQVQVWDTAGQEQFHKITTSYYKGAQGIMLVYDVSDQKSLDNAQYWIKNIKSHATDSVQVALIGNKTDLRTASNNINNSSSGNTEKKCIDTEQGKEVAMKFGIPFYETSAKDSVNVNDAFVKLVENIVESISPQKTSPFTQSLERKSQDNKNYDRNKLFGPTKSNKDKKPKSSSSSITSLSNHNIVSASNNNSIDNTPNGKNNKEKCVIS